ncbi:MAG: TetR/AcrR family transcriptional regulator [Clostridia bacterium]|nr:TetR/AcrR family transcriptional regulator [Clostridia bacterium]
MKFLYSNFESLPEEKKKKIIDVCLEEFAENGYDKASTNSIIKKAGISKGILFHYFGSKKNLFLYIVDHVVKIMVDTFYREMTKEQPSDLFDRIIHHSLIKLKMAYDNPFMYKITIIAFKETPEEVKEEIQERYSKLMSESLPIALKDIDTSKFSKDIEPQKALELLVLSLEALGNKYMEMIKHRKDKGLTEFPKIIEEYKDYLNILKYGMYDGNLKGEE